MASEAYAPWSFGAAQESPSQAQGLGLGGTLLTSCGSTILQTGKTFLTFLRKRQEMMISGFANYISFTWFSSGFHSGVVGSHLEEDLYLLIGARRVSRIW